MHQRSIGQHDFEAEDVGRGESIFQAVGAAGVLGDVAANAADGLRRRVGRVEIFLWRDAAGDVEIDDAGFDDHAGVGEVDVEDVVHAGQADDHAVFDGQGAAAQAVS